jgi:tRNA-specific adenosine deaminase 1
MVSPEQIADCALEFYASRLSSKGKPKENEWSVYAAVVASCRETSSRWVVSCATGTKCTNIRNQGMVLHDCHGEVLARRGLVRVLRLEILKNLSQQGQALQFSANTDSEQTKQQVSLVSLLKATTKDGETLFRLRPNLQLHLYISDSPCGDASIYPVDDEDELLYTGAKVIVSDKTGVDASTCGGTHQLLDGAPVAREEVQVLGKLRTKSGRSNLPAHLRSSSMSCSDKILKWCILGLQGDLLSKFIPDPIRLASVVVSRDPRVRVVKDTPTIEDEQSKALGRAIPSRLTRVREYLNTQQQDKVEQCIEELTPSVHIVSRVFSSGKAAMAAKSLFDSAASSKSATSTPHLSAKESHKRKRNNEQDQVSPCGFSLNWQQRQEGSTTCTSEEILVGARGCCQGKKPKSLEDYQRLSSRLSRYESVVQLVQKRHAAAVDTNKASTYQELKARHSSKEWIQLKSILYQGGPMKGWLVSQAQGDFEIK